MDGNGGKSFCLMFVTLNSVLEKVWSGVTVYVIPFLSPPEPFLKIRRNAKWQQSDILQGTSLYLPPEDRSRGF